MDKHVVNSLCPASRRSNRDDHMGIEPSLMHRRGNRRRTDRGSRYRHRFADTRLRRGAQLGRKRIPELAYRVGSTRLRENIDRADAESLKRYVAR